MAAVPQVVPEHHDPNSDLEKNVGITTEPIPRGSDDAGKESDNESGNFQEGVKQVRAVASVWSKKTLWIMFALYVFSGFGINHQQNSLIAIAFTWSLSSTLS